jgi:ankyrin repeat protein
VRPSGSARQLDVVLVPVLATVGVGVHDDLVVDVDVLSLSSRRFFATLTLSRDCVCGGGARLVCQLAFLCERVGHRACTYAGRAPKCASPDFSASLCLVEAWSLWLIMSRTLSCAGHLVLRRESSDQCLTPSTIEAVKMSLKFETFCAHAAHGRLADVQQMLESGELRVDGNLDVALVRAAENGHVDVVDCLLRNAMFDPSTDDNSTIKMAAANGHLAVVERLLLDPRVDPTADDNDAIRGAAANGHLVVVGRLLQDVRVDPTADDNDAILLAAERGHLAVVERLLQDKRVDPSAENNFAVRWAARNGHLAVVERLLQDKRVDPSADDNYAVQWAALNGHLAVVERLMRDVRVDPSADDNNAVRWAAQYGRLAVVDRLLEDDRVDCTVAIQHSRPEHLKRLECRKRLTEICIALQDLELPAWITVQILDAARPWSTLPLHSKWNLVCAVKHFHDKRPKE